MRSQFWCTWKSVLQQAGRSSSFRPQLNSTSTSRVLHGAVLAGYVIIILQQGMILGRVLNLNIYRCSLARICSQLQQEPLKLTTLQSYDKLLHVVKTDTLSPPKYLHYTAARQVFLKYVQALASQKRLDEYDPQLISQDSQRMAALMREIARYPIFELEHEQLLCIYRVFCRALHAKTDRELNCALLFTLKCDPKAEESVIYQEFLRFYLRRPWETLKARYQLQLRGETIGGFLGKLARGLVHRGFLSRAPVYDRQLQVLSPATVLNYVLNNSSTSSSLLIRKLMHSVFIQIRQLYEQKMHGNLYHEQNSALWLKLNQIIDIILSENPLVQRECEHLRELYYTLSIVLMSQGKREAVYEKLGCMCAAYQFGKNSYQESQRFKEFTFLLIEQIRLNKAQVVAKIQYDKHIYKIINSFPQLDHYCLEIISSNISPLSFKAQFEDICQTIQSWDEKFVDSLSSRLQNILTHLNIDESLRFSHHLEACSHKRFLNPLYMLLVDAIINKDYKKLPDFDQIVSILDIYSSHRVWQIQAESGVLVLRNFLFRFISDHKQSISRKQLQKIVELLLKINDNTLFSDVENNYQLNIFDQLSQTVAKSFLSEELKGLFKKKVSPRFVRDQEFNLQHASQDIKSLLSKIKK